MRIAVDISSAIPSRTGIGTYTYELVRRLIRSRDHQWVLLFNSLRQPPPEEPEFRTSHVQLVRRRLPGPALLKGWQRLNWPPVETLAGGPVDLFHSPATYVPPQRRGLRVTTVHDLYFLEPEANKAPLGGGYLEWVVRNRLPGLDLILTDAPSVARQVEEAFSRQGDRSFTAAGPDWPHASRSAPGHRPILPVPLGVDPYFFDPVDDSRRRQVREKYRLPDGDFLLFLGTDVRKNFPRFLRARALFQQSTGREIPVVWVGASECTDAGVLARPRIDRQDLPAVYRLAAALIMPSLHEGFGLPVLEAMACGTPVLASTAVAALEYLPYGTVPACDPTREESIADMLRNNLLNLDDFRHRFIEAPALASRFTWEETARLTLLAYDQLLQTGAASR